MTSKALKEVLRRVEAWPETRQEDAARLLAEMEQQDANPLALTDEQAEEAERRLQASERTFVGLDEVKRRFDQRR
jgi:hypothetical protein